jgi:cell wall-associated NlpC family hydrolase
MRLKDRGRPAEPGMVARFARRSLLALSVLLAVLVPAQVALAYTDVPTSYWDYAAIKYVAIDRTWMKDYTDGTFRPRTVESRQLLARTLVTIYAPTQAADTAITFPDLPQTSPFFKYASIAVKNGWMTTGPGPDFNPTGLVHVAPFDKALVLAMGLSAEVNGLANIHEAGGYHYTVPAMFPYLQLAHFLGLHFNHPSTQESMDLEPTDVITRDEVAYSLATAAQLPSWELSAADAFSSITLNTHDTSIPNQASKRAVTAFALKYVGYPYIWGGEWYQKSPPGYCCGAQVKGGFDCSGFAWWVMQKAGEAGFNNESIRGYAGWAIPQRTSYDMAHATTTKIGFTNLQTGDLMLFADDGGTTWQDADHVGIYLGNGWMIHSTGSTDGVAIESVTSGWWRDHFLWGRRLIPS